LRPTGEPAAPSEPKPDALSPEQMAHVLREVKKLQDEGFLQYKNRGYPSLRREPNEKQ